MKKETKTAFWVIVMILALINPGLLFLGIIGVIIYIKYKNNFVISKAKEKIENMDKTHNYEVIDTTAEVVDSKVIKDEWKATKEYRH